VIWGPILSVYFFLLPIDFLHWHSSGVFGHCISGTNGGIAGWSLRILGKAFLAFLFGCLEIDWLGIIPLRFTESSRKKGKKKEEGQEKMSQSQPWHIFSASYHLPISASPSETARRHDHRGFNVSAGIRLLNLFKFFLRLSPAASI
jgi:hypothetical protein